jgi:hypothetical protein
MDFDDDALNNGPDMEMDDEEQPIDEEMMDVEDIPVTQEDSWAVIRYDRSRTDVVDWRLFLSLTIGYLVLISKKRVSFDSSLILSMSLFKTRCKN